VSGLKKSGMKVHSLKIVLGANASYLFDEAHKLVYAGLAEPTSCLMRRSNWQPDMTSSISR